MLGGTFHGQIEVGCHGLGTWSLMCQHHSLTQYTNQIDLETVQAFGLPVLYDTRFQFVIFIMKFTVSGQFAKSD